MDDEIRAFVRPLAVTAAQWIQSMNQRALSRDPLTEWTENDWRMTMHTAEEVSKNARWIVTAIETVKDYERGEIRREDRQGGTPR